MATTGKVIVDLEARSSQFKQGTDFAKSQLSGLGNSFRSLAESGHEIHSMFRQLRNSFAVIEVGNVAIHALSAEWAMMGDNAIEAAEGQRAFYDSLKDIPLVGKQIAGAAEMAGDALLHAFGQQTTKEIEEMVAKDKKTLEDLEQFIKGTGERLSKATDEAAIANALNPDEEKIRQKFAHTMKGIQDDTEAGLKKLKAISDLNPSITSEDTAKFFTSAISDWGFKPGDKVPEQFMATRKAAEDYLAVLRSIKEASDDSDKTSRASLAIDERNRDMGKLKIGEAKTFIEKLAKHAEAEAQILKNRFEHWQQFWNQKAKAQEVADAKAAEQHKKDAEGLKHNAELFDRIAKDQAAQKLKLQEEKARAMEHYGEAGAAETRRFDFNVAGGQHNKNQMLEDQGKQMITFTQSISQNIQQLYQFGLAAQQNPLSVVDIPS